MCFLHEPGKEIFGSPYSLSLSSISARESESESGYMRGLFINFLDSRKVSIEIEIEGGIARYI